jgi:membrane-associated phospholipid phosphatase
MENSLKPVYGFWITASVLISIGAIASLATGKGDFLIWLAHHRNQFLDYYFYYITRAAEPIGFIIVALIFLVSSWKRMVLIPILGLLSTVFTYVMKRLFQHERPALFLKKMDWIGPTDVLDYHMLVGHSSFPSGHSMAAWALFSLVAMLYRKVWISALCIFLAVSVSMSRIYLMAHFLEDVVFGASLGCLIGYGLYNAYLLWMNKKKSIEPRTDLNRELEG